MSERQPRRQITIWGSFFWDNLGDLAGKCGCNKIRPHPNNGSVSSDSDQYLVVPSYVKYFWQIWYPIRHEKDHNWGSRHGPNTWDILSLSSKSADTRGSLSVRQPSENALNTYTAKSGTVIRLKIKMSNALPMTNGILFPGQSCRVQARSTRSSGFNDLGWCLSRPLFIASR